MSAAMQPFNVWILTPDKTTVRMMKPTTSLDIFDGSTQNPHPEGLFSTEIYGRIGEDSRDTHFSYIHLGAQILHPLVFRTLGRLKSLYRDILLGTRFATWDDNEKDFVASNAIQGQTGYAFFMSRYKDLVFKTNRSDSRNQRVELLNKFRDQALTEYILVLPAGMRDIEVVDGRISQDEINDYYRALIQASNVFRGVTGTNEDPVFDNTRKSAQIAFNAIYDYLENMIQGKKGLIQAKWARRSVFNGTRNVLSAMDTTVNVLGSTRAVKAINTQIGLYQFIKAVLPVTQYQLKTGFLSEVFVDQESQARLVNPETLMSEMVDISVDALDRWNTAEGLEKVISSFAKPSIRHKPIKIDGYYLGLIYVDKYHFKLFHDIRDLPEHFNKENVRPLSLAELLYISCHQRFKKVYGFITRYPITGAGSIYPSLLYCLTTANATRKLPLDENWEVMPDEYEALEFPSNNPADTWNDTMSPNLPYLQGLGADKSILN